MNALTSMTYLEELVISNTRPSSLRAKVLQSLIAQPVDASSTGTTSTSKKWDAPLCPSLRRFMLKYHRWLRPSEHFDLIPDFLYIIFSRRGSSCPLDNFSVWIRSDRHVLFELLDGMRWINRSDVEKLANKSRIEQKDLLDIRHLSGIKGTEEFLNQYFRSHSGREGVSPRRDSDYKTFYQLIQFI